MEEQQENFSRVRNFLIGAVDIVLALAGNSQQPGHSSSRPGPSRPGPSRPGPSQPTEIVPRPQGGTSAASYTPASSVSIEEHRRIFNYRSTSKGKRPASQRKGKRKGLTWKKDCICLRDKEQSWKPSSEEKIELVRMGLGHK